MRLSALLLALSFVLAGCPRPLDKNGERRKDVEAREAARRDLREQIAAGAREGAASARGVEVVADSLRVDDPARRLTVDVTYPVVRAEAAGVDAVNAQLRRVAAEFVQRISPDEPLAPDAAAWERYEVEGHFIVDYASETYVSVLQSFWTYTGGAHGNSSFAPQTYDLGTGRRLTLADAVQTDAASLGVLREAVLRGLEQELRDRLEDPTATAEEHLWLDGLTATPEAFEERWTMGPDSLTVSFEPYNVSAYAYGSWFVPVAYADLEGHLGPVTARIAAD